MRLNSPFSTDYYGRTTSIRSSLAKGIRFDSNNVVLSHHGDGFVPGTIKANELGRLYLKKADTTPDGGCVLPEAKNEFEMTMLAHNSPLLRSRKVFTKLPIAYGTYPNIFYTYPEHSCNKGQRENMSFVVFGINGFSNLRTGKSSVDTMPELYLQTMKRLGKTLRDLHDASIFHGSLHPGNIFILPELVIVHDFPDAVDLSKLPIHQRTGFMFADLFYASRKAEEIIIGGERAVLDGYFSQDTSEIFDGTQLVFLFDSLKQTSVNVLVKESLFPLARMLTQVVSGSSLN